MIEVKPWEPMIRCVDDSGREYWYVSFSEFIKAAFRLYETRYLWDTRLGIRVFTELGEEFHQNAVRQALVSYRNNLREKRCRGDAPRSVGTKSPGYRYHRRISTTPERRMNSGIVHDEGQVFVRGRRRHLPNSWDDFHRGLQRSWKVHRKTQWK